MSSNNDQPKTDEDSFEDIIQLLRLHDSHYGSSTTGIKVLKNRLLSIKGREAWETFLRSTGNRMWVFKNEDLVEDSLLPNRLTCKKKFKSSGQALEADANLDSDEDSEGILKSSSAKRLRSEASSIASCSRSGLDISFLSDEECDSSEFLKDSFSDVGKKSLDSKDDKCVSERSSGKSIKASKKAFKSIRRHIDREILLPLDEKSRIEHNKRRTKELMSNNVHSLLSNGALPMNDQCDSAATLLPIKKGMKAKKSFLSGRDQTMKSVSLADEPIFESLKVSGTARKSTGSFLAKVGRM